MEVDIRKKLHLKIEFIKESKAHTSKENAKLNFEIINLLPFVYEDANQKRHTIIFELKMTLIDGEVLNVLTETLSTQCCIICGTKTLQFMKVDLQSQNFEPKNSQALEYGVSPLHASING